MDNAKNYRWKKRCLLSIQEFTQKLRKRKYIEYLWDFFFVLPETRSVTSSPVPAPPTPQTSKTSKPFGYGYPALQPGYQNTASPTPVQQPSNPGHHPGFQHYPQVHIFILKVT